MAPSSGQSLKQTTSLRVVFIVIFIVSLTTTKNKLTTPKKDKLRGVNIHKKENTTVVHLSATTDWHVQ